MADIYAERGGEVLMAGKPYRPIYEEALKLAEAAAGRPIDRRPAACHRRQRPDRCHRRRDIRRSTCCSSPAPSMPASSTLSARRTRRRSAALVAPSGAGSPASCRGLHGEAFLAI